MKKESIKVTLIKSTFLSSVTIIAIFIIFTIISLNQIGKSRLEQQESTLRNNFDLMIKRQVESVFSILETYNKQVLDGELTKEEAILQATNVVRNMNYGDGNYYFVYDSRGVIVIDRGSDLESGNEFDYKDLHGNYYARDLINNGKQVGGGYTEYYFSKPDEAQPIAKRSYSKYFAPFDWVVGTGNYVDDINAIFNDTDTVETITNENNSTLLIMIGIGLCVLFISILLALRTSLRLSNMQKDLHSAEEMLLKEAELLQVKEQQHDLLVKIQADLQGVLDAVPVGILVRELENLSPLYVNTAYINMFGFDSVESAHRCKLLANSPELQANGQYSAVMVDENKQNIVNSDDTIITEWCFLKENNEPFDAKKMSRKIYYNGMQAIVTIIQDITADNKQRELLQNMADKDKEASRLKSKFVVNISHEIRTPMNAIIGLTEIALTKEFEKETVLNALRKINVSAKNLHNIINDVLDFSKIEADKFELIEEEFVLEETLANAAMVASKRIGNKPVEMLIELSEDIPNCIYGDQTRVWQIFKNLLDNSAKFTEKGKIVVTASIEADRSAITYVVTDTGVGMTPDQLERLYNSFEQFSQSQANATTGTGLGMSITKQLVELMGGSIIAESEKGVGTKITVVIPCKPIIESGSLKESVSSHSLEGRHIIVADDTPISVEIMSELLKMADCTPRCVSSGEELLEQIIKAVDEKTPIDLVLLDYKMGGKDGFEIAKEIKKIAPTTNLILVSAFASHFSASDIFEAGFSAFIDKPFSPIEFIRRVCGTLNIEQSRTASRKIQAFVGASVLLVEDNEINQEVATSMLEIFGIVPAVANNGKKAIELLEEQHFDLVFMDLQMPIMDGHEATKAIRSSDKPYKDVCIVAMTANVVKEEIEACLKEGINGHIGKPIDINNLSSNLSKWLKDFAVDESAQARL